MLKNLMRNVWLDLKGLQKLLWRSPATEITIMGRGGERPSVTNISWKFYGFHVDKIIVKKTGQLLCGSDIHKILRPY